LTWLQRDYIISFRSIEGVGLLQEKWTFMVDGTAYFCKTMEEAISELPIEEIDGEEYVKIKHKDLKRLVEFYLKEHASDIQF